jgi:glycosyltransferase involved in cell wall biosynthesis
LKSFTNKKILHITGSYFEDGTTFSTRILHNFLIKKNIDSKIAYLSEGNDRDLINLNKNFNNKFKFFFLNKFNSIIVKIFKKNKNFAFFNNFISSGIFDVIKKTKPDIIHFHWVPRTINIKHLLKLKKMNIKVIWTLRDFWAFTGGCNVPLGCNKYLNHCSNCPNLISNVDKDISYFNFKEKKKNYKFLDQITLTFPCKDFKTIYKKSILKNIKNSFVIPNSFDDNYFFWKKIKKNKKFTILFGAQNLDQEWKGTEIVINLINYFKDHEINFIIFGETKKYLDFFKNNKKTKYLNYVNSKKKLSRFYLKSDLFIFPSYLESFGKVIIESLACGTPVIANKKFGAKDIISHKKDGYLVNNQNLNDYIDGVNYFKNCNLKKIRNNCILKSKKYNIELIGNKFIQLYKKL